ncbi:MAG: hypothetical protein ACR2PM_10490 [Hyphomicrobiales bacterium]
MTCLAILGSRSEPAQAAVDELHAPNSHREPGEADVIVALGGDGVPVATSEDSTGYDRSVGVGQPDDAFGVKFLEEP